MDKRVELEKFIDVMNKQCHSNNGGTWDYDYFDYFECGVSYRYSGCMASCGMCDSCEDNVDIYIKKCIPHISKMNIVHSIEKLEKIRNDLLDKAEEISMILNAMRAQL